MPALAQLKQDLAANIPTPPAGSIALFLDTATGQPSYKDSAGAVHSLVAAVSSVFGRTGAVVATSGDYGVAQVTGAAPLASPALTGTPSAPTAAPGTNTTQLSTTAFVAAAVAAAIAALINSAPGALDTLEELADALGDDANFAATITGVLALKAPLASPALTGNPTAPTASPGDNDTTIANTAFVTAAIGSGAPPSGTAGGDLSGTFPNPTVAKANGNTVPASVAKGDLLVGSATSALSRLGVGANGEVLTADSTQATGQKWAAAQGLASRATVTKTTASLTNNSTENGAVVLAKSSALLAITADRACRVTLYQTSADRTADASRAAGTPATPGTGVLAEFLFSAATTFRTGPVMILTNGDGSAVTSIYYAITNTSGATHTVQVDFLHLALEA